MGRRLISCHAPASLDPVRSLIGESVSTAGGVVAPVPANVEGLGADLSGLTSSASVGGGPALPNWSIIPLARLIVPAGATGRVKGLAQYLSIGEAVANDDGSSYVEELPIVTPRWSFQDGFARWHLSVAPGHITLDGLPGVASMRPFSGLATWTDLRFPWGHGAGVDLDLGDPIKGPAALAVWIEVLQTDPSTRPVLKAPAGAEFYATPESRFLLSFPNAVYWRAAASLVMELDDG